MLARSLEARFTQLRPFPKQASRVLRDTLLCPCWPPAASLEEQRSLIDLVSHQRTPHACPGYSHEPQMTPVFMQLNQAWQI